MEAQREIQPACDLTVCACVCVFVYFVGGKKGGIYHKTPGLFFLYAAQSNPAWSSNQDYK